MQIHNRKVDFMMWMQVKAKNALHCLTKEKDGVDGSSIYMYLFSHVGFELIELDTLMNFFIIFIPLVFAHLHVVFFLIFFL